MNASKRSAPCSIDDLFNDQLKLKLLTELNIQKHTTALETQPEVVNDLNLTRLSQS